VPEYLGDAKAESSLQEYPALTKYIPLALGKGGLILSLLERAELDIGPDLSTQLTPSIKLFATIIMQNVSPPPSESDLAPTNSSPETRASRIPMADNEVQSAVRRARSPPRNEHNQMYCDHVNCSGKNQTFKRVCEWNKHMDRHERPYKCLEAACEFYQGFTYSGGLRRHQREVHKMHLSTKQPLFCPFPNCNRSSGKGFTRKENLKGHRRRRHREEMSDRVPPDRSSSHPPSSPMGSQRAGEPLSKRRRISMTPTDGAHQLEPDITTATTTTTIYASVAMDAFSGVAVLPESELIRCLKARL
jgi:hypothetical protein